MADYDYVDPSKLLSGHALRPVINRKRKAPLKVLGNRDHVETLELGNAAIRAWRRKHEGEHLDVRGADLRRVDLAHANLSGTQFEAARPDERPTSLAQATLREANLQRVNLRMADMRGADLRGADFRRSQLSIVDFSHADLRGANLSSSILIATNFHRAKLDNVNLTGSIVGHTLFTATDLSTTLGLPTLRHDFPSTIDVDTLFASKDVLPAPFLQGCGVPNVLITNLRSLVGAMEPIQFNSCFISYSHSDEGFAKRLHSRLRDAGVRVWFAPEDIRGGDKLYEQIDRAIQVHDRLLLVISKHSMDSEWVTTEVRRALATETRENRRKLFPIRLCDMKSLREWTCFDADTGKDMAVEVREYFVPDFSNWKNHDAFESGARRLLRDLKAIAKTRKRQSTSSVRG